MEKNKIIAIGGSAGSLKVLLQILPKLPYGFPFPIIIILHRNETTKSNLEKLLKTSCKLPLQEVEDKMLIKNGRVYIAPAGYHLLLENESFFSLDCSDKVLHSRPNINISVESIVNVFHNRVIGILLSGANEDGAKSMKLIKDEGGTVVIQSPESSAMSTMPKAALKLMTPDKILTIDEIAAFLLKLKMID